MIKDDVYRSVWALHDEVSPLSLLEHDNSVRREVVKLLADGFAVRARLTQGFQQPAPVHGYRPDIEAVKGKEQIIVEVIKEAIDWPKLSALERYAHEKPNVTVRFV